MNDGPEDAMQLLPTDRLKRALKAAQARSQDLDDRVRELTEERDAARMEAELLAQLLAVRSGESTGEPAAVAESPGRPPRKKTVDSHPVVLEAMRELAAAAHPLHISELMQKLEARSVEIPGAGTQANLIAHLRRSPHIVRPSRGIYALATWDLPDRPPLKKAKRRRVRGAARSDGARGGAST